MQSPKKQKKMGSALAGVVRLTAFLCGCMLVLVVQGGLLQIPAWREKHWLYLPPIFHRFCCWVLGIRVEVAGNMADQRPVLWVANHSSYLDIPVLGSLLPGSFVAKSEVGTWPLFGALSKLQKTIFINRKREDSHSQKDSLGDRLKAGDSVILFPEGTSSDFNRVFPFKSALFAVANITDTTGQPIMVQPVSVTCTHLDQVPLGRDLRPLYAWYGDMDLAPHLWALARLGGFRVVVEFHPAVRLSYFASRKALGQHCEAQVAAGVCAAITGRADLSTALVAMPHDIDDAKQTKAA